MSNQYGFTKLTWGTGEKSLAATGLKKAEAAYERALANLKELEQAAGDTEAEQTPPVEDAGTHARAGEVIAQATSDLVTDEGADVNASGQSSPEENDDQLSVPPASDAEDGGMEASQLIAGAREEEALAGIQIPHRTGKRKRLDDETPPVKTGNNSDGESKSCCRKCEI